MVGQDRQETQLSRRIQKPGHINTETASNHKTSFHWILITTSLTFQWKRRRKYILVCKIIVQLVLCSIFHCPLSSTYESENKALMGTFLLWVTGVSEEEFSWQTLVQGGSGEDEVDGGGVQWWNVWLGDHLIWNIHHQNFTRVSNKIDGIRKCFAVSWETNLFLAYWVSKFWDEYCKNDQSLSYIHMTWVSYICQSLWWKMLNYWKMRYSTPSY